MDPRTELPPAIGEDEARRVYGSKLLGLESMERLIVVTGAPDRRGRCKIEGEPAVDAKPWVYALPLPYRPYARAALQDAAVTLTGMTFTAANVKRYVCEANRRLVALLQRFVLAKR